MLTVAVHPEGIVLAVCFCYALSGLSLACHSKHQPLCECKPSMPEACRSAACPNRPVWPAASVQCWPAMQGHFLQLSGRDDALSRSLNSDYLAQLYINPDTKCMDQSFAAVVQRDEDLPDEAKSMLVFKRGSVPRRITHTSDSDMHACMGRTSLCSMSASLCYMQPMPVCPCAALIAAQHHPLERLALSPHRLLQQAFACSAQALTCLHRAAAEMCSCACRYGQARKRGRMLVPKLDYLQYIAVKGVFTYAAGQLSVAWKRLQRKTDSAKQAGRDKLQAAGLPQGKDEPSKTSQDSRQQPGKPSAWFGWL